MLYKWDTKHRREMETTDADEDGSCVRVSDDSRKLL